MKFRSFLTLVAIFLSISLFAQTAAQRAETRAKNQAERKANSKVDQKMAVVSDKFGLHMFSDQVDDANSRMILNTQDGKTTMVTTTKKGETSAFRMRVPRMGKILENTTADIEDGRFTFEATGECKEVDGYNCEKIIVKDTKEGSTTVSWVTQDLNFDAQEIYRSFAGMAGGGRGNSPNASALAGGYKGFPIDSTTTDGDKTFRMNFKDIKFGEDKMDKSLLDLTGVKVMDMGF